MASLTNALHLQKTRCISILLLFIFQIISPLTLAAKPDYERGSTPSHGWLSIAPGVEYRELTGKYFSPWSHIHVFRISLKKNKLANQLASEFSKKLATAEVFAKQGNAFLAINGGFFDNQSKPLGLRLTNHQQQNPIKPISWWGVFYIQNQKPYISSYREFDKNPSMEFAIQSGPRLLINNRLVPLKPGIAERTALGITKNKQVIILVTENSAMSTSELARLLQSEPLSCTDALNLDGGSSTQLYVDTKELARKVSGFIGVSDAVVVKPRKRVQNEA